MRLKELKREGEETQEESKEKEDELAIHANNRQVCMKVQKEMEVIKAKADKVKSSCARQQSLIDKMEAKVKTLASQVQKIANANNQYLGEDINQNVYWFFSCHEDLIYVELSDKQQGLFQQEEQPLWQQQHPQIAYARPLWEGQGEMQGESGWCFIRGKQ